MESGCKTITPGSSAGNLFNQRHVYQYHRIGAKHQDLEDPYEWQIYSYREDLYAQAYAVASKQAESPSHKETFIELLKEFELR
ncbi:MAG: hypothetical protein NTW16_11155 [Bacteroidetes bacterium]|nr:hypothetical protein [Bacteroidota bacterium]